MDPLNAQHKEMTSHSLENMLVWSKAQQARKPRPQPEQSLKCPRCDSANTKFCYYNNYSLSQPRYFCKSCRRYWTKGGTLRNVPGGGGCRKNKRSSSASSSKSTQDIQPLTPSSDSLPGLPASSYEYSDLTIALTRLRKQTCEQLGYDDHQRDLSFQGKPSQSDILGNNSMATSAYTNTVFIDALRSGVLETQNNNLYYGFGEDDYGNGVGIRGSEEMMLPNYDQETSNVTTQAVTVTTVKHELCNGREQSDNRISWGFPGLFNGEGNIDKLDPGRETWNNFTSSWHGLLSTPNVDSATPSTQNGRKKLNFSVC